MVPKLSGLLTASESQSCSCHQSSRMHRKSLGWGEQNSARRVSIPLESPRMLHGGSGESHTEQQQRKVKGGCGVEECSPVQDRLLPPLQGTPRLQRMSPGVCQCLGSMELPQKADSVVKSFRGLMGSQQTGQPGGGGRKTRQSLPDSPRPGVSETDVHGGGGEWVRDMERQV